MSPRRGPSSLGRAISRRTLVWVGIVVVALVVIDVVLVGLAVARTAPETNGTAGPIPTFSSTPIPTGTGTAAPQPTATSGTAAMVTPGRHLLSATNGLEAWRASSGTCGGDEAVLQHTVDGGKSWTSVGLGDGVSTVLALRASSTGVAVVAGTGDDCAPTVRTSTDDGATWKDGPDGAAGAAIGTDGLLLKSGTVDAPCPDPIEVFEGTYTTAVTCDGEVQWRSGTGAWVAAPIDGVRSLADAGNTYTLARTGIASCEGVQIASMPAAKVTATTEATAVGCAADADASGAVTIARSGQHVWLWAGDLVQVSGDGGVTW
ncbi:WD40/YVTN/BNR-like repeat-containing protein [Curtobacterium sp. NPDC090217]|uniref:WD40/YVTN/BNR-like repeat-containing protein n=1 Tax=Curtobacterium sp. NPDC090217 TaxID=3363970 RepID=UPI003808D85B